MKKSIVVLSSILLILPFISFGQSTQAPVTPVLPSATVAISEGPIIGGCMTVGPGKELWCINNLLNDLIDRVKRLEARVTALESKLSEGRTCPTILVDCIQGTSAQSYLGDDNCLKWKCVPNGLTPVPTINQPLTPVVCDSITNACSKTSIGNSGQIVETIQKFLKAEGSFTYPTATGYFGSITQEALKQFQTKQGIPTSGQIDIKTLETMKMLAPTLAPSMSIQMQKMTVPQY